MRRGAAAWARASILVLAMASITSACGDEPASAPSARGSSASSGPAGDPELQPIAGGVGWTAEEPFVWARPDNDMRAAQYTLRGAPGVVLTVSHFDPAQGGGGEVDANVARWAGQFEPLEVRETERRRVHDLAVTVVDLRGTFVGREGMGPAGPPRPGWRVLGAIVEGPRGLVFFKMLGPSAGVDAGAAAFEALVATIHPEE
ncbi:MAG: hypothetical protein KF729_29420 [Sandaracinaceae bacterium]|nr:hypothetical protein [Sandaracinaceae bacterium]